jgi:putative nucleotidyltransferase with HDIG domain
MKTDEYIVLDFLKKIIKNTEFEDKVFLAGGGVRDEIMGKVPKDLDFVVLGDLNAGINFSIWLSKKLNIYKEGTNPVIFARFGTSKLTIYKNQYNLPKLELEFVATRKEEYTDGSRKPKVANGELIDDVMRRDLTINSLLKNISTGEILDLTNRGISDIKNKIIRTTSEPDIIFKDDPLRMMRAIRFSVKYNFKMERDVLYGIQSNAKEILKISKERIKDELNKILLSDNPDKGIKLLKITGLLKYVIEEFELAYNMKQNMHHKEDVFKHTLSVLKNTPPELKTRLMALFHDIGKVLTRSVSPEGSVHFYGHEKVSEEMVRDIMTRLKYPNELIDSVSSGVRHHMALKHGGDDATKLADKSLRKFASAVGENLEYILDLIHADNISHSDESAMPKQISIIRDRINKLNSQIAISNMTLPLNGNDIIKMGVKPSKKFREILNAVQEAWYDNPNITKEDAIEIAEKILQQDNINEIKRIIKFMEM